MFGSLKNSTNALRWLLPFFAIMCPVFSLIFLRNRLFFSVSNKPNQNAAQASVLAVATAGFSLAQDHARDTHTRMMISNFVNMCERGFDVTVVFTTYDSWSPRHWLADTLSAPYAKCMRTSTPLDISVRTYPLRELPMGAFGTSGDLQIRHREIFLSNRGAYDFYLHTEDDIGITARNLEYYIDTLDMFKLPEHELKRSLSFLLGAKREMPVLFPSLFSYERHKGRNFVDWRMQKGDILTLGTNVFYYGPLNPHCGARAYVLPKDDLSRFPDTWAEPSKVHPKGTSYEFNPHVGTLCFPEIGEVTVLLPLRHWFDAGLHHLPDKYISGYDDDEPCDVDTYIHTTINQKQIDAVFNSCLESEVKRVDHSPNTTFVGQNCYECLASGQISSFQIQVKKNCDGGCHVTVRFECNPLPSSQSMRKRAIFG